MTDAAPSAILWIDDNPERSANAIALQAELELSVEFYNVSDKNLRQELPGIRDQPRQLLIIDHVLDKTAQDSLIRYGTTATQFLKEEWGATPVVGVTAAAKAQWLDLDVRNYDLMVKIENFSNYHAYIKAMLEGFPQIQKVTTSEDLLDLLDCPELERKTLCDTWSADLFEDIAKPRYPSRFHDWFRTTFHAMPGFLYDMQWVATLLGVKDLCIEKYIEQIEEAQYKGIFTDLEKPRWWAARLLQLIGQVDQGAGLSTQEAGCLFLHALDEEKSSCYASKKLWPDYVAYVDEEPAAEKKQMFRRYTKKHPQYRFVPGYQEPRVMVDD